MGSISNREKPWRTVFEDDSYFNFREEKGNIMSALKESKEVRYFLREQLEHQIQKSPIEIKTVFDLYWWLQFTLKWQEMIFLFLTMSPNFTLNQFNNLIHFYRTEDFQLWSILNHDKKIKDTWQTFKFVVKDFIYDFTKDSEYRDTKKTFPSADANFTFDDSVNTLEKRDQLRRSGEIISAIDSKYNVIDIDDIKFDKELAEKFRKPLDDHFIKWRAM